MIPLTAMAVASLIATPATGWASQYAPGVMQKVIANRQRWKQIGDVGGYDGYVAVRDCQDIGRTYRIRPVGTTEWERFLAVDCACRTDRREHDGLSGYAWMVRHGIWFEVDYETAQRWSTVGRGIKVEWLNTDCGLSRWQASQWQRALP